VERLSCSELLQEGVAQPSHRVLRSTHLPSHDQPLQAVGRSTYPRVAMMAKPPAPPTLDDHVFETMLHWFDKFVAQTQAADSHRHRQGWFRKLVREGWMPLRRVIELTSDRNAALDADEALRAIADEINERGEKLPQLLTSYLICHPRPARGRGRRDRDNWLRDCVGFAIERWSAFIPVTRNEETDTPSLCSLMSKVCHARGIPIGEKRVKQIYLRFAEFMPGHQSWLTLSKPTPI
jgi:hypothetical protein